MKIGIFQLLPAPETLADREVVEQALWEVDFAEANGFDSVWIAEHHLSSFGLVGAPSVFAAAVAQRTERVGIGYAVAVLPLHHPLRLAEEIAWVDHLSRGRLMVGVGPGFSPYEFAALDVPFAERQARFEEGMAILRGALEEESFSYSGRFWSVPPVTLRPRPYRGVSPPFLRASSGEESLRAAALAGVPVLLGLKPVAEIAERVALYRRVQSELGRSGAEIDREVGEIRVLRRIAVADTDEEAFEEARRAVEWENRTAERVHGGGGDGGSPAPTADGSPAGKPTEIVGGCIGTPATVVRELLALRTLGIRHVIAWLNFGDMPYAKVRRSMELIHRHVLVELQA
jgi:alkanesulfonate monooxygenase SsuD/methylene tetrahydromethanopterin reductase-like flavin-dependent oxidoreductase (luciferase family)